MSQAKAKRRLAYNKKIICTRDKNLSYRCSQFPLKRYAVITQIMTGLRFRYPALNDIHYEAGWTESWCHRRCMHAHETLIEAAKCGMPQGAGWYVFAVERGEPRELLAAEDSVVERFRFGK